MGAPFDQTAPRRRRKVAERKPAPSCTEPGCASDGAHEPSGSATNSCGSTRARTAPPPTVGAATSGCSQTPTRTAAVPPAGDVVDADVRAVDGAPVRARSPELHA